MTLLSIANDVADETKGARPAAIAGGTNPDAQNIFRLINKVGTRLMRIHDWNILRKEHTFTAPGSETLIPAASMPSDFDRFVPETFWHRSADQLLSGPIGAVEWQGLKSQGTTPYNKKFTYRGGDVLSIPTFDAGASFAFEYVSKNWCQSSTGTAQAKFAADNDVAIIDEELITYVTIYEWLKAEGQPWDMAAQEAKRYLDTLIDNDMATDNITTAGDIFARNSRHFTGAPKASHTQYDGNF